MYQVLYAPVGDDESVFDWAVWGSYLSLEKAASVIAKEIARDIEKHEEYAYRIVEVV